MEKTYQPQNIESKWYKFWEESGFFKPTDEAAAKNYCIVIPPPNVTGTLHMGHAFQDTIMDLLIRYHRMKGDNTLWQPGTDHAGIATQMVVERRINREGLTRHDLGRNKFIEKIWEWKEESGGQITQQLRRMGASPDWTRERFTMDEGLSKAVKKTFIDLYRDGLIYRGKRLVNWDPVLKTAISDLEVVSEEEDGFMYHVRYPFVKGQGLDGEYMHIATTRPETILADGALAIAPNDERYAKYVGKKVHVPMTDRIIPIIEDEYVDPEFGTGCVKITPAHDFNDYQVGLRHEMEVINLMNDDATLNENAPKDYQGLSTENARNKIVEDLKQADLLVKIEPHKLMRPRGDRTGVVIEPYLTDQWYVNAKKMAIPAIEVVKNKEIKFVPENWEKTYFEWMNNIEDWCISRQLWWGHQIPAWYDNEGNIYVGESEDDVRSHYNLGDINLTQDEDVLDTWFSSALWPFSTLGWPEKTPELDKFYPTSVLVTGFDIIFFWVARMIMMGMHFMGKVPFKEVYIHGLVRDQDGQKMSKSKGNVLDPIDLIDGIDLESLVQKRTSGLMQPQMAERIEASTRKTFPEGIKSYGTDALRLTFAALATNGRDIIFDVNRVEGYSNFCNKIWNAARFVFMNTEDKEIAAVPVNHSINRWILSRLSFVIAEVERHFAQYRFDLATQTLYDFTWNEFCDWYLELTKPLLNGDFSEEIKAETRYTLLYTLEAILKLFHPFMPYITEEIWQQLTKVAPIFKVKESICVSPFPKKAARDEALEDEIKWLQSVLLGIRRIRAEMNIAPSKPLSVLFDNASSEDLEKIERNRAFILRLGRLESFDACGNDAPESAVAMVGKLRILIPLAGLIDKEQEIARLTKEIEKTLPQITQLDSKLSNEGFVAKAPEAVVAKEREKLAALKNTCDELKAQLEKIKAL